MPRTASDELINELTVCAPSLPDRLFSTVHVCLLYGRLRHMGGPSGGVVSNLFAVAEHHSEWHHPGIDGDRAASLFLLCHSAEHGCANLPLRVCGSEWGLLNVRPVDATIISLYLSFAGHSICPVVSDQLGREDVRREDTDTGQSEDDHPQRGAGPDPVHFLGQDGHPHAERDDL